MISDATVVQTDTQDTIVVNYADDSGYTFVLIVDTDNSVTQLCLNAEEAQQLIDALALAQTRRSY
jgi:hypothetical protein